MRQVVLKQDVKDMLNLKDDAEVEEVLNRPLGPEDLEAMSVMGPARLPEEAEAPPSPERRQSSSQATNPVLQPPPQFLRRLSGQGR